MLCHARLVCWCLVSLVFAFAANADTLEEVEKKLAKNHHQVKSFIAQTETTQDFDMGGGNKMKSETTGTIEWMRQEGKELSHIEMKTSMAQSFGGQEMKTEQSMIMVNDGEFVFMLTDTGGRKQVMKQKSTPAQSQEVETIFENLRKDHILKVLPDEKVNGKDCYVIEATPKKANPAMPVATLVLYFSKDLGIGIKTVGKDKDGKAVLTTTMTDIKLNTEIAPDRFKFERPEGVQFMDMTGGGR